MSVATLRRWITRGLPVYRAGGCGRILVKPADIDRFLTRHQAAVPDLDALAENVLSELVTGESRGRSLAHSGTQQSS